jgi:hypothetical protein
LPEPSGAKLPEKLQPSMAPETVMSALKVKLPLRS